MEIALMIEGQNGVNWAHWQRIAQAVEDLGFVGLYRSDHFTNAEGPDLDSLELWLSLTWLASHTKRIEFGQLVSPPAFRHPAMIARMASQVDDLSGGRLTLGLGAGWQVREHTHFGFDLLDVPERFARFQEYLEVVTRLLHSDQPVSFSGKYYHLQDAILLPRPQRRNGPPICIGGNGAQRTLPLVAQYADEWNAVFSPPDKVKQLNAQLDALLLKRGRTPQAVRRSLMTGVILGRDATELQRNLQGRSAEDARARGLIIGTPEQMAEQLQAVAEAGVQRVMLQWLNLEDMAGLHALAKGIL